MPSVATTSKILAAAYAHPTLSLAEASEDEGAEEAGAAIVEHVVARTRG